MEDIFITGITRNVEKETIDNLVKNKSYNFEIISDVRSSSKVKDPSTKRVWI